MGRLTNEQLHSEIKIVKTECAKAVAKYLTLRYGLFVGISA